MTVRSVFHRLKHNPVMGSCVHGNKLSVSIEGGNSLYVEWLPVSQGWPYYMHSVSKNVFRLMCSGTNN
jgi:hypothetical protein